MFLQKQASQYKGADWKLVELQNGIKCLLYAFQHVSATHVINFVECWLVAFNTREFEACVYQHQQTD